MYMQDWIQRLDSILQLNGRELLTHAGSISHKMAIEKSNIEFRHFEIQQKAIAAEQNLKELEAAVKSLTPPKK